MKTVGLFAFLILPIAAYAAGNDLLMTQAKEPDLYDHFRSMEQTQERLSKLPPEEQQQLQPKIRRAEHQACERLKKERQAGVRDEDYRRQGGAEFLGYALQFEKYCETLR